MSVAENYNKNTPEYYDTMYLDGYTPQEIYQAHKKRMDTFVIHSFFGAAGRT